jgi:general secretion pathway protein J
LDFECFENGSGKRKTYRCERYARGLRQEVELGIDHRVLRRHHRAAWNHYHCLGREPRKRGRRLRRQRTRRHQYRRHTDAHAYALTNADTETMSSVRRRKHLVGFTLLEVLVAIAIFAVVGMLALTGYNQLVKQSERAGETMARVRAVQIAVERLSQDLEQLEPRPIRDPLGQTTQSALIADARTSTLLQLTRAGWTNPAAVQRSTLQRVAYRLEDGKLHREYWPALDSMLATEPVDVELLDKVRSLKLRFMLANGQWVEQWPVAATSNAPTLIGASRNRPIAIEFALELDDWGLIKRTLEIAG